MSLYDVLSIARDATPEQIKRAYHQAALDNHPDRHPGDKAREAKFKRAAEAYAVLSDPEKRAQYDAAAHVEAPPAPPGLGRLFDALTDPETWLQAASSIATSGPADWREPAALVRDALKQFRHARPKK